MNDLLEASYKTYRNGGMTQEKFYQSLQQNLARADRDGLINLLGFDPSKVDLALIAEAYEIASFLGTDEATLQLLTTFAKDYVGAQSTLDWAEFTGGGVFEIVLAALLVAFTGGVGIVGQVGSKVRHLSKLRNLGYIFRRLGKLLKRKKLNKKVRALVDSKKKVKAELPEGKKLSAKKTLTYQHGQSDGGPGTWQKQTTPTGGADYQHKVTGAPKDTEYVVKTNKMKSGEKKFDGYDPETNTLIDSKDWKTGKNGCLLLW